MSHISLVTISLWVGKGVGEYGQPDFIHNYGIGIVGIGCLFVIDFVYVWYFKLGGKKALETN